MASSPAPPVPFKDHCSIVHNNVLYVYSPDAFQTLELRDGAEWKEETNGVSVTGGVCVKGGMDGNKDNPALYIVGGSTNSSSDSYTGLQRYSIEERSWKTIALDAPITKDRKYHGAAYLNASSALVVYGGQQDGSATPSTETFLMLMYEPFEVQAYSSVAPPVLNAQIHPWDPDRAVLVAGSTTSSEVYIFHPDNSWQPLGLALPEPIPDKSVAQTSLLTLDDDTKILLTYRMDQSPNVVTRNVLRGAFNMDATPGQTIGDAQSPSMSSSRVMRRQSFVSNYPAYNSTDAPSNTRTDFALALGQRDLTAVVGGDTEDSTVFFNPLSNSWVSSQALLGEQKPLTSSVSSTPTMSPTSTPTRTAAPSSTTTAAANNDSGPNTLAILGGVLGGVCGLAAILIILLLWMRQLRRKKAHEAQSKQNSPYPEAKGSFEDPNVQPLSAQGQPMGRSPVASAIIEDRNAHHDSLAMFSGKIPEKAVNANTPPSHQHSGSSFGLNKNPFTRQQSPLTISKPMLADLGDYKASQPGIELGRATPTLSPAAESSASAMNPGLVVPPEANAKKDQRKTDEGWASYFQADQAGLGIVSQSNDKRDTVATDISNYSSAPPSRSGGGGFWPGSGVHHASRSPKPPLRSSEGATLTTSTVSTASPTLQAGPMNPKTATMSVAEGTSAKISRAESISTSATDDDDYEDDRLSAYSSGVPHNAHNSWTPFGSSQDPRPVSSNVGGPDFPLPSTLSNDTSNSSTSKTTIPTFPMPATIRHVQPAAQQNPQASGALQPPRLINPADYRTSEDYFGRAPGASQPDHHDPAQNSQDPSDMSWINLGTPVQ